QGRLALDMEAHTLPPQPFFVPVTRDDFASPALGLVWNYLRNPDLADYSLTERPGWLRLRGSARTLDEAASPTFVGRRQEHFRCRATTLLDFTPQAETDEAGLTVLMNEHHHYEIARCGSKIILRRRIGSLSAVTAEVPFRGGPVQLRIEADAAWYHFSYAYPGEAFQPLGTGETRYLSTEVGGAFTGVYLGLYAVSQQQTAAAFDGFDYEPLPET
ncbi:MAG TPA: hypothetical protein VHO69_18415, partial [Phototrophicaceae bacterium]|nr:hypothetical protein [Phototrophicaceae bacterium]